MKVYFFPGVGADESLARYHPLPGHAVEWVRWPDRETRSWPEFVEALAEENPIEEGAVFIGISFGGMAALKLASLKKPRAVILPGSCRSSRAVSPSLRLFKPVVRRLPAFLFNMNLVPRPLGPLYFGLREKEHIDLLFAMGRRIPPRRFRNLNTLALHYESDPLQSGERNLAGMDPRTRGGSGNPELRTFEPTSGVRAARAPPGPPWTHSADPM